MTDWNYYEAARRFQRVLEAAGVVSALRRQGIQVRSLPPPPPLRRRPRVPPRKARHHTAGRQLPPSVVASERRRPAAAGAGMPKLARRRLVTDALRVPWPPFLPQEGDTVVVGEVEFDWSDDTSEAALFDRWQSDRRAAGIVGKGQARWPHAV